MHEEKVREGESGGGRGASKAGVLVVHGMEVEGWRGREEGDKGVVLVSKGLWSGESRCVSGYLAGSGYRPRRQVLPRSLHTLAVHLHHTKLPLHTAFPCCCIFLSHLTAFLPRLPLQYVLSPLFIMCFTSFILPSLI